MRRIRVVTLVSIFVLAILISAPATVFTAVVISAARADTQSQVQKALDYLRGKQQSDGGFAEPGQSSSDQVTTWVIAAIKSAGEDPASWKKAGKSPIDFLQSRVGDWKKLTDVERGCLAVASAGADPRSFGGRNLVADIKARMAPDGHVGDMVNEHCWALIALKAASEPIPDSSRAWLAARQNVDGGFGFSQGVSSDPDDTGATLQALVAAGENQSSSTVDRALKFLKFCQAADGGFCWSSTVSNVASTAWAVQGIAAAGGDPGGDSWKKDGKTPLDYLASMQQADGHIRYMKDSDSQPVWMTAEAIPAFLKQPFPLNANKPAATTQPDKPAAAAPPAAPSASAPTATSPSQSSAAQGQDQAGSTPQAPLATDQTSPSPDSSAPGIANLGDTNNKRQMVKAQSEGHGRAIAVLIIICGTALVLLVAVYFVARRVLE